MNISIPEFSLVVLVGVSGSGKSTFARRHFLATEILSSDFCRSLVCDDENSLAATDDAFDVLHYVAAKRLANMKLTVVDATNVQAAGRKRLVELARSYHALPVALVLDLPEKICRKRNAERVDRQLPERVIGQQCQQLRRSLKSLKREGFRRVQVLRSEEDVAEACIEREKLWTDRREERGPFDIIGDVHGCFDELVALLEKLGYEVDGVRVTSPEGRKVAFLGDLVDRGPKIPEVLELVMGMVEAGTALCVPGNHDVKLERALQGRKVQRTYGLVESLAQLEERGDEFRLRVRGFIDSLVSHYVLDEGRLVVAHAGMKAEMAGRASGAVRQFAIYGDTTGESDEFGLPVRQNWAAAYRGEGIVVYGHTPVPRGEWLNDTINIDTGCVFGGSLTALRYPEKELVAVSAARVYCEPVRPFLEEEGEESALSAQQEQDDLLDLADVTGKRMIDTGLYRRITIREENAAAALEVMSRFAADPRWLVYLPPTMAPSETSRRPDWLEHPDQVFAYYRDNGVERVICQEKHMGSRALVIACRDEEAARSRFGVLDGSAGICYTRTGRRFFETIEMEGEFLRRVRAAIGTAGMWEELDTDWMVLDCELMPWSARAQQLLQDQYAATGAAAGVALDETVAVLETAARRGGQVDELLAAFHQRRQLMGQYVDAYRRYCWPVVGMEDLKLAPFHLMASEGAVHHDKDHLWHMEKLGGICEADRGILQKTVCKIVDTGEDASFAGGVAWWEELTERGGEGMVVKPVDYVRKGGQGWVQPAIKCRGREYLRIIYGPEYTEKLEQLRQRGLKGKRSLALREFFLGLEGLERFVRREPLRRVHECVFGVLALESEPVDPRL
ncbi:MAG: polynucleotide kinase-phosphatase [Gemmatimonadetes bacterium]|jgi:protein phosphatase|nr:polynucleotide kinase-phosphatase [Gemmatimonadota bacterium]